MKIEGPRVKIKVVYSCTDCEHNEAVYYFVEDGNDYDSGYDYYCRKLGRKYLRDDKPDKDCPFLEQSEAEALRQFMRKFAGG